MNIPAEEKWKGLIGNIGSNNGLAPNRHQAIIWTKGGLFLDACYDCVNYFYKFVSSL